MPGLADIALSAGRATTGNKSLINTNIIEFVEAPWGLGLRLFPVQKVVLKAHYGLSLNDTEKLISLTDWRRENEQLMTEADYLRMLYDEGRSNVREIDPGHERRELVLSIGRRSGKTLLASCICAFETYKLILKGHPQKYFGLPDSNVIQLISVATDKDQAGLLYREVLGHYTNCGFFSAYMANYTQTFATFQTPYDIASYGSYKDDPKARFSVKVTFRSCIAKGLRGAGNIVVVLDELAHFTDAGQSSAEDVYNAVTPSTSAFSQKDPNNSTIPVGEVEGRIVSISSPLGRQGQFYKLFQIGMRGGKAAENMLCIQAPTWEVNPTLPAHEFEKHYVKDARVFFTEYGAVFSDRTRGWIEDEKDLVACIDHEMRPKLKAAPRVAHYLGLDLGLVNDGTAVAIGHIDEQRRIVLDYIEQIKAGVGEYRDKERLEFTDVADWVYQLSRRFYISEGMFDQYVGIPLEQALATKGLKQLKSEHFTKILGSDVYRNFKDMMFDRRLVLYDWPIPNDKQHCAYVQELLELQAEYHSKYITTVAAPNVDGKHDDFSDALVRMVWVASQHLGKSNIIAGSRKMLSVNPFVSKQVPIRAQIIARKKALLGGSHEGRQVVKPGRRGAWPRGLKKKLI